MQQPATKAWATPSPSFVIVFASLLLVGSSVAALVAAADAVARSVIDRRRAQPWPRMVSSALSAMLGIQAAGLAHQALGGTSGHFSWPWQAVPIAAAVLAYCIVASVLDEIALPFVRRQPVSRAWPTSIIPGCTGYFIVAAIAVGLVETIDHRMWEVVPAAAVPLLCAHRAYRSYLDRVAEHGRRREVVESLDGMAVVDATGRVALWDDALERLLACGRDRALGRTVVAAVPALGQTDLPRAITDTLTDGAARTVARLALPGPGGVRILRARTVRVADGATILLRDITEEARIDHAVKRNEERLSLAAEGANDGLWEWDLRSHECYFSARWNAMIGLPASARIGRLEDWTDRVHQDDIVKLKAAIDAHLAGKSDHLAYDHQIRHEDGTYRRFLCRGVAARGPNRRAIRLAGSLTDTTEQAITHERLRTAGFLDPLTGLCNRAVFVERLGQRLQELKDRRNNGNRFAALYLDLDRFKVVNDSLGHMVGDELLTAVSRRLESCLRHGDALARLGGDEFAILLNGLGDDQQANAIAFRIQDALSAPFSIGGREVFTSASIGIAFGRVQYDNPDEIMRDADAAMYQAKARGKARHELFDADMHARALDRLGFENDLRHAVSESDFEVHYQPIVSLATGMCVGFESLVRWTRNGEAISPATFIPIAEELGLIETLGTWVLQQACTTFADWQRRFPDSGLDCITVNVSSRQLVQHNFFGIVEQAIDDAGINPRDLRLEITETALMDSPSAAAHLLRQLRDYGVKIYLDDFGTGYSSLSHLHKLPVDALKIDRSFVKSLLLPDRPAIVESILALARTLNTSVVAEGIETEVQARELARLGCTHAQGYLFSRPLSMNAAEGILLANQPLGPRKTQQSAA